MKVAIVYDWVNRNKGGAERVLLALNQIWPQAPLYTSVYNFKTVQWADNFPEVKTSFVNSLPVSKKRAFWFYPLIIVGFEQFNFDDFDLVISVTTGPAKAVITKPETKHVCYCLTPPRFVHNKSFPDLKLFQKQDFIIGQRPDMYFATCKNVAERIKKQYDRNPKVVYPGINLDKFNFNPNRKPKDYYLIVSRLVPHKKAWLAVNAFNQLGWPLKIVGKGRAEFGLKLRAKNNIQFLGQVSDEELVKLYQECKAVIFPQEEDFGLVPIEAQACGRPVIGFQGGGALETIIPGKTGEFFKPQTTNALIKKLKKFNPQSYSSEACRQNAEKFSIQTFKKKFQTAIKNYPPS